jgi:glycosyltransferase involved in cell wall biosynthesis
MMTSPTVDVVMNTRNRSQLIRYAIDSLQESSWIDFQAYIVDQSTDQETAKIVEPVCLSDSRFHYIHTNTVGLNISRNIGINSGTGQVIAYIDDDCSADPLWLESIVNIYLDDPDTMAVFGKILPDKTNLSDTHERKPDRIVPMAFIAHTERRVFQNNRFNLGFGHGANMSYRREIFDKVGMFDELLGTGSLLKSWPERDMGYRILKEGGKIIYTPDALVTHHHWRRWPEVIKTYKNYAIGCGAAVGKYIRKGDYPAILLLFEWIISQGIRAMLSGIIKWRSWHKFYIGFNQVIYPFVGLFMGFQYKLSSDHCTYLPKNEQTHH